MAQSPMVLIDQSILHLHVTCSKIFHICVKGLSLSLVDLFLHKPIFGVSSLMISLKMHRSSNLDIIGSSNMGL